MKSLKWYGWKPDVPDHRDRTYTQLFRLKRELPSAVDLRDTGFLKPIYNQLALGSCTGNAISKAIRFDMLRQADPDAVVPSRLFIYYNERVLEDTVPQDCGAQIRDGIKSISNFGVCDESMWPYDIDKFAVRPPDECYSSALDHQALAYHRLSHSILEMKDCLSNGLPFIFGFSVFESFESQLVSDTGVLPYPALSEYALGGHAVLAVGYIDGPVTKMINGNQVVLRNVVIAQNSWDEDWGDGGYFYIPYSYISNPDLADDRWVLTLME